MKILVIRFSSIGDIILTTPVIRCLKLQVDNVAVHYLTKKAFEPLLVSNPYIDKLHLLNDKLSETVKELKGERFDYVIDLHRNLRTRMIKLQLGVQSKSFDKLNLQKFLLVNFKVNILPEKHIVERYLETISFLGAKNDGKGLDYFFNGNHKLEELLPPSHHHYVGIVIGAQHSTKRLPVAKLITICKDLNRPIVLLGGKEDAERGQEICANSGEYVYNACGKFSIDQSSYLVMNAQSIVTHDTGLMHIASAFDKPIVSVWGNTIPEFGMYPYKVTNHTIAEVKGLKCRPCSKIGYKKCPLGHFKCMNDMDESIITTFAKSTTKD